MGISRGWGGAQCGRGRGTVVLLCCAGCPGKGHFLGCAGEALDGKREKKEEIFPSTKLVLPETTGFREGKGWGAMTSLTETRTEKISLQRTFQWARERHEKVANRHTRRKSRTKA